MVKKMLKMNSKIGLEPTLKVDRVTTDEISIKDFCELHEKFMEDKSLQGLAPRTLEEHKIHMGYLKRYLEEANKSTIDCSAVNGKILKGYVYYMVHEKGYMRRSMESSFREHR